MNVYDKPLQLHVRLLGSGTSVPGDRICYKQYSSVCHSALGMSKEEKTKSTGIRG